MAFDPLDGQVQRVLDCASEWCIESINIDLLKQRVLHDLQPINGKQLSAPPLSVNSAQVLNELFQKEREKCSQVFLRYVKEAKVVGSTYKKQFSQERTVHRYKNMLKYLKEKEYLPSAEQLLHNFYKFIDRSRMIIEQAKSYAGLSEECQ